MNTPAAHPKLVRAILLVLAGCLFAGQVQAEWVVLGRNETMRLYVDRKLIRKNGDFMQILQLMDFAVAQWVDARTVVGSLKILVEYDCSTPRFRPLSSEAFSEQMGDGQVVSKEQVADPQWEVVEAGTTPDKVRQIACAKK